MVRSGDRGFRWQRLLSYTHCSAQSSLEPKVKTKVDDINAKEPIALVNLL